MADWNLTSYQPRIVNMISKTNTSLPTIGVTTNLPINISIMSSSMGYTKPSGS